MLTTIILCTLAASIFNGLFYFLVSFFLLKRIKNLIKKSVVTFEKLQHLKKRTNFTYHPYQ